MRLPLLLAPGRRGGGRRGAPPPAGPGEASGSGWGMARSCGTKRNEGVRLTDGSVDNFLGLRRRGSRVAGALHNTLHESRCVRAKLLRVSPFG